MSNGLGVAVFVPGAAADKQIACIGVPSGAAILQVLNLITGADVTSSFDGYVPAQDTIVQLDVTPSSVTNHFLSYAIPGAAPVTVKFAIVNSIGSGAGTHGSVTAAGVAQGDVIVRAYSPVTDFAYGNAADLTNSFAPTAPSANTVTQISGINTADAVMLLLVNSGAGPTSLDIGTNDGSAPGGLGISSARAGDTVLAVLDLTAATVFSQYCVGYVAADGGVLQKSGTPTLNDVLFFLFERHP